MISIPEEQRTEQQKSQIEFFRLRGATFLMATAISKCCETYAGRAIADKFQLKFKKSFTIDGAINAWSPIVKTSLGFSKQLMPGLNKGLKNAADVKTALDQFSGLVDATTQANAIIYSTFSGALDV